MSNAVALQVRSDRRPMAVRIWTATSSTRDYREAAWSSTDVREEAGNYRYICAPPSSGFVAFLSEADFADDVMPYRLSANVRVVALAL